MSKRIAVITGASSGMGREFVTALDRQQTFDELWLIARREDRLTALQDEVRAAVRAIPLDLCDPASIDAYKALLEIEQPDVRVLVNAGGFGRFGAFTSLLLEDQLRMIDLNDKALVAMTYTTLPFMRAGSCVYQLGSLSSFQPVPYINVYGASKAFVLSFSRALNRELAKRGISVTAVCPFWTKTGFFDRAVDKDKEAVVKKYAAMYETKDVIARAWRDAKKGKDVSMYGFVARAQTLLTKILPHSAIMTIWMKQQKLK